MGWRDRDYARWTDQERDDYYGGPSSTSRSWPARWIMLAVAGLLAVFLASIVSRALQPAPTAPPFNPDAVPHAIIYGWWNVPPVDTHAQQAWVQGNRSMICRTRQPDTRTYGGYVCTSYSIINPGQTVVPLSPSDPELIAPCSQAIAPGGHRIPCPLDGSQPA